MGLAKPLKRRITEGIGFLFMIALAAFMAYVLFAMLYWEPHHRPVVVMGGTRDAPWTVWSDGAPAKCEPLSAARREPTPTCRVVLATGEHRLAVRDAGGKDVFTTTATIAKGDSTYLWAPEIPEGSCLYREEAQYMEVVIVTPFSHGPKREPMVSGFQDVGQVDYWFEPPPRITKSRDQIDTQRGIRLVGCE